MPITSAADNISKYFIIVFLRKLYFIFPVNPLLILKPYFLQRINVKMKLSSAAILLGTLRIESFLVTGTMLEQIPDMVLTL